MKEDVYYKLEQIKLHFGTASSNFKQAALEFYNSDKTEVINFEYNKIPKKINKI
jgi:hypothetical protein